MTPIIGIAGKARSGKDTLANMIVEITGGYRYGFADPIKLMTDAWLERGEDTNAAKEAPIPQLGKSRRQLWQTLGTEWGRNLIHPDLWLIIAGWALEKWGPGMVISDVRFENEAAWIRSKGGLIVHIERPEADGKVGVANHASEAGIRMDSNDGYFLNDRGLDDMRVYVRTWLLKAA